MLNSIGFWYIGKLPKDKNSPFPTKEFRVRDGDAEIVLDFGRNYIEKLYMYINISLSINKSVFISSLECSVFFQIPCRQGFPAISKVLGLGPPNSGKSSLPQFRAFGGVDHSVFYQTICHPSEYCLPTPDGALCSYFYTPDGVLCSCSSLGVYKV
jgi:hypothetical protein